MPQEILHSQAATQLRLHVVILQCRVQKPQAKLLSQDNHLDSNTALSYLSPTEYHSVPVHFYNINIVALIIKSNI